MKFIAAVATLTAAAFSTVSAQAGSFTNWANCGGNITAYPLTVTSAVFTPMPLCVGERYCFQITGTSNVPITQGTKLYAQVVAGGRLQPNGNQTDICTLLAESGTPCPIPAGPVSLKFCYKNTGMFTNTLISWVFNSFDANNERLFCQYGRTEPTEENPNGELIGLHAKNCVKST
ncbi:hypothetical protein BGW39_011830 [Mortierella sp. 14UC]|nr:hypothetical protein BGW39_011830 [Mortierella sp. 14UC]